MKKSEINAVVNAFLIECINNDDVGSIDCFKAIGNFTYYRNLIGRYKREAFYIYVRIYKDKPISIRIDTDSKEALEFINSFNIISNE